MIARSVKFWIDEGLKSLLVLISGGGKVPFIAWIEMHTGKCGCRCRIHHEVFQLRDIPEISIPNLASEQNSIDSAIAEITCSINASRSFIIEFYPSQSLF